MAMRTEPAVVAGTVVELARQGCFADIEELFAPPLRAVVSAEALRAAWSAEISRIGPVSAVGRPVSEHVKAGLVRVSVPVTCERGALTVVMSVDEAGRLQGLRLAPPPSASWEPPDYAAARTFTEQEVTIGSGPLTVPGTVTVPRGSGPWPGVVLLAGGRPSIATKPPGRTNRSRIWPGDWPIVALRWRVSTR